MHLSPAPQGTHADAPVTPEYVPAQHRDASVDRHARLRVAVLHELGSGARRHAAMLHLSSAPHCAPHTLLAQYAATHTLTHTHTARKVRVKYEKSRSMNEYIEVKQDYSSYIYQER